MRLGKIILGILLLLGTGSEYINASEQMGNYFAPEILIFAVGVIIFSTWLIGSGLVKDEFKLLSAGTAAFFILSFLIFILAASFTLLTPDNPRTVEFVNNVEIPLDKCIRKNQNMIQDKEERKKYCQCLAEKLSFDTLLVQRFSDELTKGNMQNVILDLEKEGALFNLGIDNCFPAKGIEWNDELEVSLKQSIKHRLTISGFEQTNDINKYCDCIFKEYKTHPLTTVLSADYQNSDAVFALEEYCTKVSLK